LIHDAERQPRKHEEIQTRFRVFVGLHLVDGRRGRMSVTLRTGSHPQGVAVDTETGVVYVVDRLDHSLTSVQAPDSVTAAAWR